MTKPINKHGGKRKNQTGRPKKEPPNYDMQFKESILQAAKELAEEHGRPIEKEILGLVYDSKTQDAVKASIWKTYVEMFIVKKTEKDVTVKDDTVGPRIGLPPMREDSALKVVSGGKK